MKKHVHVEESLVNFQVKKWCKYTTLLFTQVHSVSAAMRPCNIALPIWKWMKGGERSKTTCSRSTGKHIEETGIPNSQVTFFPSKHRHRRYTAYPGVQSLLNSTKLQWTAIILTAGSFMLKSIYLYIYIWKTKDIHGANVLNKMQIATGISHLG